MRCFDAFDFVETVDLFRLPYTKLNVTQAPPNVRGRVSIHDDTPKRCRLLACLKVGI